MLLEGLDGVDHGFHLLFVLYAVFAVIIQMFGQFFLFQGQFILELFPFIFGQGILGLIFLDQGIDILVLAILV